MRILFVHNALTRFVRIDRDLLQKQHQVTECYLPRRRFNPLPMGRALRNTDLVFGWFASWHTLLPVLLARLWHKPAVVVVGGYDTANLPEIGYGSRRGGLRRLITNAVIRHATHLLPFSYSAERELLKDSNINLSKVTVIYLGVPDIPVSPMLSREPLVLTVGGVWQENLYRKGLLPFVQAAHHLPNVQFVVVGRWFDDSIETLRQAAAPNVTFTGYVSDEALKALYNRASVYVQASQHEGFGMSVAEAMLAGCMPVVTRTGSLPEVVGDVGVYIRGAKPELLAAGIQQALNCPVEFRIQARQRILNCFSLTERQHSLMQFLSGIVI